MNPRTSPILRNVFATVGVVALLLAVGTVTLALALHPPDVYQRALWGSLLYFAIGGACAYAFVRLKR